MDWVGDPNSVESLSQNIVANWIKGHGIVSAEANSGGPSRGALEQMARRRFQNARPKREGRWWYLLYWQDIFANGASTRKRKRHKLAPATLPEREVKKMAAEFLRPMNQGLDADWFSNPIRGIRASDLPNHVDAAHGEEHSRSLRRRHQELSQPGVRREVPSRFDAAFLAAIFFEHVCEQAFVRVQGQNPGCHVEHSLVRP